MRSAGPPAVEARHLRYFIAVFEELHFGRAAARLHISQPPLSQAIRRLEQEVGVGLLERTSRGVKPTAAGRTFAHEARKALAQLEISVREARRVGGLEPALRIGHGLYLPTGTLLELLDSLRDRVPDLVTQVSHLTAHEQIVELRAARLDVGILPLCSELEDLEQTRLCSGEPLVAVVPADNRLARKARLEPADLRDEPLVMFPRAAIPELHDRILEQAAAAGYRFEEVRPASGPDPRNVILAVALGTGVSLLPFSFVRGDMGEGHAVWRPLDPLPSMPDTVLAWRRDPPPRLRPIIPTLREIARERRSRPLDQD